MAAYVPRAPGHKDAGRRETPGKGEGIPKKGREEGVRRKDMQGVLARVDCNQKASRISAAVPISHGQTLFSQFLFPFSILSVSPCVSRTGYELGRAGLYAGPLDAFAPTRTATRPP